MDEIQSLTQRVADLGRAVDFWNVVMLWGLALAAIAAVVIGVSTRLVVLRTGEQADVQESLSAAKESRLTTDLKEKDRQIATVKSESDQKTAELRARAKEADARIANANAASAKANETAEGERLARVKIEERLAWRRIGPKVHDTSVEILKPYRGAVVRITVVGMDNPEMIEFAKSISSIFTAAQWRIAPSRIYLAVGGLVSGRLCQANTQTPAGRALAEVCSNLPGAKVETTLISDAIGLITIAVMPPP